MISSRGHSLRARDILCIDVASSDVAECWGPGTGVARRARCGVRGRRPGRSRSGALQPQKPHRRSVQSEVADDVQRILRRRRCRRDSCALLCSGQPAIRCRRSRISVLPGAKTVQPAAQPGSRALARARACRTSCRVAPASACARPSTPHAIGRLLDFRHRSVAAIR